MCFINFALHFKNIPHLFTFMSLNTDHLNKGIGNIIHKKVLDN